MSTAEKLDNLTVLVNSLASELNANVRSIKEDIAGLREELGKVETNVDTKIEDLRTSFEKDLGNLKKDFTNEIKTKVDEGVDGLREEVVELRQDLARAQKALKRLTDRVDVPFPPDVSVVIYGLENNEGEDEEETVNWLFAEVLKVDVTIENIERTKPRDTGKIGVIKVELSSVEEKITVLRNKLKCDNLKDNEKVIIKSCESHDARVNRINNKLILSMLPKGQEYNITGHGIIRKKDSSKSNNGTNGGQGSDAAESADGNGGEDATRELGDNREKRDRSPNKQYGNARGDPKPADQKKPKQSDQSTSKKEDRVPTKENDKQKARGDSHDDSAKRKLPKRSSRLQSTK